MNSTEGLKRGISIVFLVNVINLAFKLITNFVMPKFLEVNVYADFKYYQLLVGYLGILHFGFVDGVYLKYGGKEIGEVSKDQLGKSLSALIILEILVTIATVVVGLILKDPILFSVAFAVLPTETAWFYKYVYQATGEFSKYGRIMNINTVLVFILEMVLIIFNVQNVYYYIAANTVALFVVWILLERKAKVEYKRSWFTAKSFVPEWKVNISSGVFVMLGNFASQLLTSLDRWFIKFLMDATAFAQYSFAASIVVFLNVAVTPFSITFYNYFCNHRETKSVKRIENSIYIFAAILIILAFPVKWILEHFIKNYIGASDTVFFLFGGQAFSIIISCIFVNLYKAQKRQRIYSIKMAIMIVIGAATNALFYYFIPVKESFAVATLVTTVIWYVMCEFDFKEYLPSFKAQLFLAIEVCGFLYSGIRLNSIVGFIVYCIFLFIGILVFMRKEFHDLMTMVLPSLSKK